MSNAVISYVDDSDNLVYVKLKFSHYINGKAVNKVTWVDTPAQATKFQSINAANYVIRKYYPCLRELAVRVIKA